MFERRKTLYKDKMRKKLKKKTKSEVKALIEELQQDINATAQKIERFAEKNKQYRKKIECLPISRGSFIKALKQSLATQT